MHGVGALDTVGAMKRGQPRSALRVAFVTAAVLLGMSGGALAAGSQAAPQTLKAAGTGLGAKKVGAWTKVALAIAAGKPGTLRLQKKGKWLALGEGHTLVATPKKRKAIAMVPVADPKQVGPVRYGDMVALRAANGKYLRWVHHALDGHAPGPKQATHFEVVGPGGTAKTGVVTDGSAVALRAASGKYFGGSLEAPKLVAKPAKLDVGQVWAGLTLKDPDEFLLYEACNPAGCPRGYHFEEVDWLEPWNYTPVMVPFSRYTVSVLKNATTFETFACVKDVAASKCCARTTCKGTGTAGTAEFSTTLHPPKEAKALIDACDPAVFGGGSTSFNCSLSWTCTCSEAAESCQKVKQPSCPGQESIL